MTFTPEQIELQKYLEAKRDETLAWIAEDPENRGASYAVTDPAHWAEWGIYNVEQYKHHETATAIYEITKDYYGYKPSWSSLMEASLEDLEAELKEMCDRLNAEEEREQADADATIQAMLDAGAPDRETAERWAKQS